MRRVPGIPLLYLHGNAPTLERPSAMTETFTEALADGKTNLRQVKLAVTRQLGEAGHPLDIPRAEYGLPEVKTQRGMFG